ncbi:hypothetical protein E4T56_gene20733 [Termitomyces sp. T112]|nr:hypothetical protein E4T56_gene20733 [Termitomyces sp. T112]
MCSYQVGDTEWYYSTPRSSEYSRTSQSCHTFVKDTFFKLHRENNMKYIGYSDRIHVGVIDVPPYLSLRVLGFIWSFESRHLYCPS